MNGELVHTNFDIDEITSVSRFCVFWLFFGSNPSSESHRWLALTDWLCDLLRVLHFRSGLKDLLCSVIKALGVHLVWTSTCHLNPEWFRVVWTLSLSLGNFEVARTWNLKQALRNKLTFRIEREKISEIRYIVIMKIYLIPFLNPIHQPRNAIRHPIVIMHIDIKSNDINERLKDLYRNWGLMQIRFYYQDSRPYIIMCAETKQLKMHEVFALSIGFTSSCIIASHIHPRSAPHSSMSLLVQLRHLLVSRVSHSNLES